MNQPSTDPSSTSQQGVSAEAVSRRAYEIWESEGRPEGADFRHWLQAEQELTANRSENPKRTETSAAPRGTTAEARPPAGNRAANTGLNRDPKRSTGAPFPSEKN